MAPKIWRQRQTRQSSIPGSCSFGLFFRSAPDFRTGTHHNFLLHQAGGDLRAERIHCGRAGPELDDPAPVELKVSITAPLESVMGGRPQPRLRSDAAQAYAIDWDYRTNVFRIPGKVLIRPVPARASPLFAWSFRDRSIKLTEPNHAE